MHEAERTPCFFTGSEVIKEAIRRANCDVMIAYPITPQSEAAALIGELFAEGFIGDYFGEKVNLRSCPNVPGRHSAERGCSPRRRVREPCAPWKTFRCGLGRGCPFK